MLLDSSLWNPAPGKRQRQRCCLYGQQCSSPREPRGQGLPWRVTQVPGRPPDGSNRMPLTVTELRQITPKAWLYDHAPAEAAQPAWTVSSSRWWRAREVVCMGPGWTTSRPLAAATWGMRWERMLQQVAAPGCVPHSVQWRSSGVSCSRTWPPTAQRRSNTGWAEDPAPPQHAYLLDA